MFIKVNNTHINSRYINFIDMKELNEESKFLLCNKDFFIVNNIIYNRKNILKVIYKDCSNGDFTVYFNYGCMDWKGIEEKYYEEFISKLKKTHQQIKIE